MTLQNEMLMLLERVAALEAELYKLQHKVQISKTGEIILRGTVRIETKDGVPVVMIAGGEASTLTVCDEQGNAAFTIGSAGEGQHDGLQLRDRTGKVVAQL